MLSNNYALHENLFTADGDYECANMGGELFAIRHRQAAMLSAGLRDSWRKPVVATSLRNCVCATHRCSMSSSPRSRSVRLFPPLVTHRREQPRLVDQDLANRGSVLRVIHFAHSTAGCALTVSPVNARAVARYPARQSLAERSARTSFQNMTSCSTSRTSASIGFSSKSTA